MNVNINFDWQSSLLKILQKAIFDLMVELILVIKLVLEVLKELELVAFEVEWLDNDESYDYHTLHKASLLFHQINDCVMFT